MLRNAILVLIPLLFVATTTNADTLIMEGINPSGTGHPDRGASKDEVAQAYGDPVNSRSAVGDPPISSWEYGQFIVFFEYDRVVHTVTKR